MKSSKIRIMSACAAIAVLCAMLAGCSDHSETEKAKGHAGTEPSASTTAEGTPTGMGKTTLEKYAGCDGEEVFEYLTELSKEELTEEVKQAFSELSDIDIDSLIVFAAAIGERINEYTEEEIIEMIMDENNDTCFRYTLIDIYQHIENQTENGSKAIRAMLADDAVDDIIKTHIILCLDFSDDEGLQMLREIADSDNEELARDAEKTLRRISKAQ